jgi:hypothetical protein
MGMKSAALQKTFAGASVRRSAAVTIIVGTTLNAINQGPELLRGVHPVLWKIALTYCVPFVVASYGSYAAFRSMEQRPEFDAGPSSSPREDFPLQAEAAP